MTEWLDPSSVFSHALWVTVNVVGSRGRSDEWECRYGVVDGEDLFLVTSPDISRYELGLQVEQLLVQFHLFIVNIEGETIPDISIRISITGDEDLFTAGILDLDLDDKEPLRIESGR